MVLLLRVFCSLLSSFQCSTINIISYSTDTEYPAVTIVLELLVLECNMRLACSYDVFCPRCMQVSVSSPDEFQCPPNKWKGRFSYPDLRNHTAEEEFKNGKGFIYYQHLRKAGGTGFCEMASRQDRKSTLNTIMLSLWHILSIILMLLLWPVVLLLTVRLVSYLHY